ncbi:MBL fold metallo-hydrolase [Peribacillus butanolivorans]|uniref:MBL fold metallo-hydrolase n=1 Tax=Peribacillus butanolivorans TaxID=421767 RepID=UPI0030C8D699
MSSKLHSFQFGTSRLMAISDGAFPVSKDFFFANTPEDIIHHIPSNFIAPLNFLLIDTGDKNILVDAGFGESHLPIAGKLLSHLETHGIYPEDIHSVIITHGHMDHIGGLSNNGRPTFPNAEYIMRRDEWDLWKSNPKSNEYKKLMPLKDYMTLITSDTEIVPGIRLVHTPGHTVGHLSLSVSSEGKYLLVASDILNDPTTLQHLPSHIRAEMSPKQGLETRRSFLQDAIDKSALLFVCHYPFPGFGHIAKEDLRWKWIPLAEDL